MRGTMRCLMGWIAVSFGALPLVAACGGGGVVEASAPRPVGFAGVPLLGLLAPADTPGPEHLRGYRWAGLGEVPWPFEEAPGQIPFGPLGRTPSTILYLTFDGSLEREVEGQTPRWSLEPPPGRASP